MSRTTVTFVAALFAVAFTYNTPAFAEANKLVKAQPPGAPVTECDLEQLQKCQDARKEMDICLEGLQQKTDALTCGKACQDKRQKACEAASKKAAACPLFCRKNVVTKRVKRNLPPYIYKCMESSTPYKPTLWSPPICTCPDPGTVLIHSTPDHQRRAVYMSCVPTDKRVKKIEKQLEDHEERIKALEDGQEKLKERVGKVEGDVKEVKSGLEKVEGDVKEVKSGLEKVKTGQEIILGKIDRSRFSMMFGVGGVLGTRKGAGFAGFGRFGLGLLGRLSTDLGFQLNGGFSIGSSQTTDLLLAADISVGPTWFITDNHRLTLGPYLQTFFQPVSTRDENGLGNDLGFAAGGRFEYAVRFEGTPIELAPYIMLGGGPSAGTHPKTGAAVSGSGVQFMAGASFRLWTGGD